MIAKSGTYFEQKIIVACDANCQKAWGNNNRPRIFVGDPTLTVYPNDVHRRPEVEPANEDDYFHLADDELGVAPEDPGTYEGRHAKPCTPDERLNKWCVRECERSVIIDDKDAPEDFKLPDYSKRQYNIYASDPDYKADGK